MTSFFGWRISTFLQNFIKVVSFWVMSVESEEEKLPIMAPCIHNATYRAHPSHMISVSHTLSSDWVILVKQRRQAVSTSTSCSSMTTVAVQSPRSGGGKNRWSVSAVLRPSRILWSWLIGQVRLGEVRTEWPCVWTWLNRCPCETTLLINTKLFAYAIHSGTVKGPFLFQIISSK